VVNIQKVIVMSSYKDILIDIIEFFVIFFAIIGVIATVFFAFLEWERYSFSEQDKQFIRECMQHMTTEKNCEKRLEICKDRIY
jgi:hypothetical protein